ncbi:MAG: ParB/RepB/Spo0J family partition protein [Minisyncoccia bacterium]
MDNSQPLGQGLNALIPNKKQNSSQLEDRINHKVNESVSHFPSDLREQKSLGKLRDDFKNDFERDFKTEILTSVGMTNDTKMIDGAGTANKNKNESDVISRQMETTDVAPVTAGMTNKEEKIFQIETEKIKPNPYQPRHIFTEESIRELANSIREFGILQPLLVMRKEKETEKGTEVEYQLIAGERRLMAAKSIGLITVPVIIKRDIENQKKLELALIENIQREDLGSISKAKAFERLINEFGLTQQELAERLGKSREVIANTLRLLQLPLEIQTALDNETINEGHARAILVLNNPEQRKLLYKEIIEKNLSGREAMDLAQRYLQTSGQTNNGFKPIRRQNVSSDPQDLEWKEKLEEFFQMPVIIKKKGERGAIEIKFFSEKDFDTILKKFFPF